MKKIILFFMLSIIAFNTYSQDYSKLAEYEFENVEDYKLAEEQALECTNYLLDNPIDKNELNRLNAIQYLMKWMGGTPDYMFTITPNATKLTKGNSEYLGLYFAAMTKVVLENSEQELSEIEVDEKASEYLIAYCYNSENNLKPSKAMKKRKKNIK